jgi:cyclophilin family peptidyl-prolyl cis-trans isomerase
MAAERTAAWPWRPVVITTAVLVTARGALAQFPAGFPPPRDESAYASMLRAEDTRAKTPQSLEILIAGLAALDSSVRRMAVRALGRLERPDLVSRLSPRLDDRVAGVRAEAANALGQAVFETAGDAAAGLLLQRLQREGDPGVRGVIAQTLGRLRLDSADAEAAVEAALAALASEPSPETRLGAARGFESFARRVSPRRGVSAESVARLQALARHGLQAGERGLAPSTVTDRRIRRLATTALLARANRPRGTWFERALVDPDPQVRRIAVAALSRWDSLDARFDLIALALADRQPSVRWEALRVYGARLQAARGCGPLLEPGEPDPHVALLALDLLGAGCASAAEAPGGSARAVEWLAAAAAGLPPAGDSAGLNWHRAAHALVALARLAPGHARPALAGFATHATWLVRLAAARAAAVLRDAPTLERLAADPHDNVRHAAVQGLAALRGHDADAIYIAQLARSDHQLLREAARALAGSPNRRAAVPALIAALERETAEESETGFDARIALLERIGELGSPAEANALGPYLTDFEPRIAAQAADILSRWTGAPVQATPRPRDHPEPPSRADLAALEGALAIIEMRGGGRWVIRLRAFEAPTNVWRFVTLARRGTLNGLTFHRVVPNFVIQGLSPGANEYQGDAPYTRDELVMDSHLRGTVGISTRGRDTGDNQIFVNLVDNPRLDHNYTIIGDVVEGMDVVDRILEGAVVEKIAVEVGKVGKGWEGAEGGQWWRRS